LLALGAVALFGLKPWATTSVSPSLSVSSGLGLALGQEKAVAKAPSAAPSADIAAHRVAGGKPAAVVAKPTAHAPARHDSHPSTGVSPAQPVPVSAVTPSPSPPAVTQPVDAPPEAAPEPPPSPGSPAPVVAGAEEGAQAPPVTAGVEEESDEPEQSCEGDHYKVTISFEIDEATGERFPTEILVEQIEGDESVSELRVDGDLSDYRDLIAALGDEGACVEVEFVPAGEGEDAGEAPEADVEAAEPGEAPEPAVP
jgi:hypothetical protein